MREELPSGVDSMPLAMYAFMSGYVGWRFSNKFMSHAHSLVAQCRLFHHLHYLVRLYDRWVFYMSLLAAASYIFG